MITKILQYILFVFAFVIIIFGSIISWQIWLDKPVGFAFIKVGVAGTGSMYPTFAKNTSQENSFVEEVLMYQYPSGLNLAGKQFFPRNLVRGDIVAIENKKTHELTKESTSEANGLVKRIIGLPGDRIMFRSGELLVNDQVQVEKYLSRQKSSFGSEKFPDCQEFQVPSNSYFVLGDNRPSSLDSRHELGFVSESDILAFIPFSEQNERFGTRWNANEADNKALSPITSADLLPALNAMRTQNKIKNLKHITALDQSAILRSNFFADEKLWSNMSMEKALNESNYSNIVWSEIPLFGRYRLEDLVERLQSDPKIVQLITNPDYQDFGMTDLEIKKNSCPSYITILHFAGYKPASYARETIDSWQTSESKIREIISSWENIQAKSDEKAKLLSEIRNLLQRQLEISMQINLLIKNRQYMSAQDEVIIAEFDQIGNLLKEKTTRANEIE